MIADKNAEIIGFFQKATQESIYADPTFSVNRNKFEAAGLLFGAYHFDIAGNASAQANNLVAVAGKNTLSRRRRTSSKAWASWPGPVVPALPARGGVHGNSKPAVTTDRHEPRLAHRQSPVGTRSRNGPIAENLLRDIGIVASKIS